RPFTSSMPTPRRAAGGDGTGVDRRRRDATDGSHPTCRPAPPGARRHLGRGDHALPWDPVPAGRAGGPRRPGVSAVARLARDSRRRRLGRRGHPHVPRRPWLRPGRPIRGSAERVRGGHRRPTLDPRIQVETPEAYLVVAGAGFEPATFGL